MKENKCVDCGKVMLYKLSKRWLCPRCAQVRQRNSANQIRNRAGPIYEKWKERLKRSLDE